MSKNASVPAAAMAGAGAPPPRSRFGLRSRLIILPLIVFLAGGALTTWTNDKVASRALETMSLEQMSLLADATTHAIIEWCGERCDDLRSWKDLDELHRALADREAGRPVPAAASALLADLQREASGNYEILVVADRHGRAVAASDSAAARTLNVEDREYFQEAFQGRISLSDVIRSRVSNNPVMVIAVPIQLPGDSRPAGVLLGALDISVFSSRHLTNLRLGENGYAFMVDEDGRICAHPDTKLILEKNLKDFSFGPEIMARKNGVSRYNYQGEDVIAAYRTDPVDGWMVVVRAPAEQIFAGVKSIRYFNIGLGFAIALLLTIILFISAGNVVRPMRACTEVAEMIAAGSVAAARARLLDTGRRWAGRRDEVGRLLAAVETMTGSIARLAEQVRGTGEQLVTAAQEVTTATQHQEKLAANLGDSTTHVAAAVREISATARDLADNVRTVARVIDETAGVADQSRAEILALETVMRQLTAATADLAAQLNELQEKSGSISGIVTTMTKVADQTNLLSLNAAIEAEKAGEYGRGFAVVAREISRLADQSAISTTGIARTVTEIQTAIGGGMEEMNRFGGEVKKSADQVAKIAEKLADVIQQVQALSPRFDNVVEGAQAQAGAAGGISQSMLQLDATARQAHDALAGLKQVAVRLHSAAATLEAEIARLQV